MAFPHRAPSTLPPFHRNRTPLHLLPWPHYLAPLAQMVLVLPIRTCKTSQPSHRRICSSRGTQTFNHRREHQSTDCSAMIQRRPDHYSATPLLNAHILESVQLGDRQAVALLLTALVQYVLPWHLPICPYCQFSVQRLTG